MLPQFLSICCLRLILIDNLTQRAPCTSIWIRRTEVDWSLQIVQTDHDNSQQFLFHYHVFQLGPSSVDPSVSLHSTLVFAESSLISTDQATSVVDRKSINTPRERPLSNHLFLIPARRLFSSLLFSSPPDWVAFSWLPPPPLP